MGSIIIGIIMRIKFLSAFILLGIGFILFGCTSPINEKVDYPYKIIKVLPSPYNKQDKIVLIKAGIEGGATVAFAYQFFISSGTDSTLYRRNMFLWVNGLEDYQINWTSLQTIDLSVRANRVVKFLSNPYVIDKENMRLFNISHFIFDVK
jgi:hypothetical protein